MEKSKFIKNSVFLVPLTKKLILFTLPLLLVMIIVGCKKEPLSDRQVTMNLAGDWEFNKDHLLGMWKPVYLTYTKDGKEFSGREVISSDYTVEITDNHDMLRFAFLEIYTFDYSTPSYFVHLRAKTYKITFYDGTAHSSRYNNLADIPVSIAEYIKSFNRTDLADFEFNNPTGDELKIYTVLEKARSFVIRNDELFILFTGIENINLLILKNN